MNKLLLLQLTLFVASCNRTIEDSEITSTENLDLNWVVDGFDFPVGKPDAEGYYDAQHFGANHHLGEDWNGKRGGNTDFGDPVYAIAKGKVSFAQDIKGGWGNVIRIVHTFPSGRQVESLYAHCDEIFVKEGDTINKGIKIGTIGTANGQYPAHLHFEIRDVIGMPIGRGYSLNKNGYLNPSKFIYRNRNLIWEK